MFPATTILLHLVAALSFDGQRTQQIKSWPLAAGYTYELARADSTSDADYCLGVLEEPEAGPAHAVALVRGHEASGRHWHSEHFESVVVGGSGVAYSVIAWPCRAEDPPATVIVTLDIRKRRTR